MEEGCKVGLLGSAYDSDVGQMGDPLVKYTDIVKGVKGDVHVYTHTLKIIQWLERNKCTFNVVSFQLLS